MSSESDVAALNDCSDEDLVGALLARHPAAELVAWRRFLPVVKGIVSRRLGPSDATDDVTQEVFAYFFRGAPRLRDPKALRAFVITLANRAVATELRRRQRRARLRLAVEVLYDGVVGESADPASRHAFWRLCRLLTRLKERERRVLLMCTVERREAHEAAEILGVSVATIRRALARARERVALWGETDAFLCELAAGGARAAALHAARVKERRTDSPDAAA